MRASNRAIRSPVTWLLGVAVFGIGVGATAILGKALLGSSGGALGVVGAALATLCVFKLLLPWRARRVLPSLTNESELEAFDQVLRAEEGLERMAAAIEDGSLSGPQRPRPNPGRIQKPPRRKPGDGGPEPPREPSGQ
jgi:hypothetical protein